ncbi:zeta toxin family protein [Parapedobacter sp. 10938]|uniref:zeta toxin family protein n=1 Tax=Parapedobacter flavus TaxID=3110225 RepID=UPI002DB843B6|nr:zeta toxin family protein [Parapedobacter sp. 10938]MEC3881988.1 zeta toxin family protein [Parapedobacter sp. 10938]
MPTITQLKEHYRLNEAEHEKAYRDISSKYFSNIEVVGKPAAYYLAGQPGSGKTALRKTLYESLSGNAVILNTDDLREYHPSYTDLKSDPELYHKAPVLVNHDSSRWVQRLIADAISMRANIIFDSTLGAERIDSFERGIMALKESHGYAVGIHALIVKPELSRLGIYLRYENDLKESGAGRFVEMSTHDLNYRMIPDNIEKLAGMFRLDEVSIYRRRIRSDGGRLVNNAVERLFSIKDTDREKAEDIKAVINEERARPLEPVEREYYRFRYNQVVRLLKERGAGLDQLRKDLAGLERLKIKL